MSRWRIRLIAVAAIATLVAGTGTAIAAGRPGAASSATGPQGPTFEVGAAVGDFTPPKFGGVKPDPADCIAGTPLEQVYNGPRPFAFEEPYIDLQGAGHYVLGDPFIDCGHNGRWDGNFIGGGTTTPATTPRWPTR